MTTVFIAGSLKIKHLDNKVKERIDKIVTSNFNVVVGDADGADKAIQSYLFARGANNTIVYCSGSQPRNNVGHWPVRNVDSAHAPGSRAFFTAKDAEMAKVADYGLMVWDAKSTGTLSNVIELLRQRKKSIVFVNKEKEFKTVGDISHLEALVTCMSEDARRKADEKLHLFDKIQALKHEQSNMFVQMESPLTASIEYEAYLLESIYQIVDKPLAFNVPDELIYPANGSSPTQNLYGSVSATIGDWRTGFLEAGTPLVFVTLFKLLDMLVEWVLVQNGGKQTHRFAQKVAALNNAALSFPLLIDTRPWLRERLIALYEQLEPFRGTIIHDRHFKTVSGTLRISCSKGGTIGPLVLISPLDLRNLALVLVSLLRCLEGAWTMDLFREKQIRRALDELTHLHRLSSLGQLPPHYLTVRLYVPDDDPIKLDITRIRGDILARHQLEDVIFDLRVIAVAREGTHATAYLVPWNQLHISNLQFCKTRAELTNCTFPLPLDIDLAAAARDMNLMDALPS